MSLVSTSNYPVRSVLRILLQDKTTKQNIMFATNAYDHLGAGFHETNEITVEKVVNMEIVPRVEKELEHQRNRTRSKAEVFTPKDIVKKMVDMLEEENPGCFDAPDKTFIDLYMKSGLYITEIVKRLYQSEEMKRRLPDRKERLNHIFAKQVYGLAPTEIIYRIAINYILGFADDIEIDKHNFRQADALPYAKEGTLDELLDELYGTEDE